MPKERTPTSHSIGGKVRTRAQKDTLEKKNHSPLMGIEPQFEHLVSQSLYWLL